MSLKLLWTLVFTITFICIINRCDAARSFAIDYQKDIFVKDGEPFRYVSGSIHYFRVPHELWADRLQKAKFGGLNVVETYIDWSSIERRPGEYDFSGNNNITQFILEAHKAGLLMLIRVGPYVDAELDMGGLPPWLLHDSPHTKLRVYDPQWLVPVSRWLHKLLPILEPHLYKNGGPILLIGVEDELGGVSGACNLHQYKVYLGDLFHELLGKEVILITSDSNYDSDIKCGMMPNVFATTEFGVGTNISQAIATVRRHQAHGPIVNSEYYPAWFDIWEAKHSKADKGDVANTLDEILKANISVNIYMYHGGTSWGFKAGSNDNEDFTPIITSYDYDAPISEAGDLTPKFFAIKEVIKKYFPVHDTHQIESVKPKMNIPKITMKRKASIFDLLSDVQKIKLNNPTSFEQLNHSYGFMLYSTEIAFDVLSKPVTLSVPGLHDRAQVFVDKKYVGTLSLMAKLLQIPITVHRGSKLDILVENQGRISVGPYINQRKGILSEVKVNGTIIHSWTHQRVFDNWPAKISHVEKLENQSQNENHRIPTFYSAQFTVPNHANYPHDSFLKVENWNKGFAFVNGHNLGRYWPQAGPQKTLYVPSTFFKPYPHQNQIVLFELEESPCSNETYCFVSFVDEPEIDGTFEKIP